MVWYLPMAASVQILPLEGLLDLVESTADRFASKPLAAFSLADLVESLAPGTGEDPSPASFRLPSFVHQYLFTDSSNVSEDGQDTDNRKGDQKQDDPNPTRVAAAPVPTLETTREILPPILAVALPQCPPAEFAPQTDLPSRATMQVPGSPLLPEPPVRARSVVARSAVAEFTVATPEQATKSSPTPDPVLLPERRVSAPAAAPRLLPPGFTLATESKPLVIPSEQAVPEQATDSSPAPVKTKAPVQKPGETVPPRPVATPGAGQKSQPSSDVPDFVRDENSRTGPRKQDDAKPAAAAPVPSQEKGPDMLSTVPHDSPRSSEAPNSNTDRKIHTRPRKQDDPSPRGILEVPVLVPAAPETRLPSNVVPVHQLSVNIPTEIDLGSRAVTQDSPKTDTAPKRDNPERQVVLEQPVDLAPTARHGELAFAARLLSQEQDFVTQDPAKSKAPSPISTQVARRPAAPIETGVPSEKVRASTLVERFVKPEAVLPPAPPVAQSRPAVPVRNEAPPTPVSPTARMDYVTERPAAPTSSSRDITVRVPDATERGTDVRFVERGGEVHVSVRTADAELAQTLRGGLHDFVGRLDHSGIQAEVWTPASNASSSQNNSQNQSHNQTTDHESFGRNQPGSQDRGDDRQEAKTPRWVEELETSIGQQGIPEKPVRN